MDALLSAAAELVERYGPRPTKEALRHAVERARAAVADGGTVPDVTALIAEAAAALMAGHPGPPRRVVNATGVIIHTNLGRAPLSAASVAAVVEAAGYCDVEYDLDTGARGKRSTRLAPLLTAVTGAAAGMAVNNAAAALVLSLAALAGGRQVLVSRGELVEIGGSFRLPEIMSAAGVELVEVGTTNRTRAADYEAGDNVAVILKVHPSNYRITGFAEAPSTAELAEVSKRRGVPLLYDVGSGLIGDRREPWATGEPSVTSAVRDGANLVICSGDKLLGGPQAGLLVGDAELVAECARHPLARAVRLDKLRLAALVATLQVHARGALEELPVWSSLLGGTEALRDRLAALQQSVPDATIVEGASVVGGGSAPQAEIPTPVLRITAAHPTRLAAGLRGRDIPVIVRIEDDAVLVDVRTVAADDDEVLAAGLRAAVQADRPRQ